LKRYTIIIPHPQQQVMMTINKREWLVILFLLCAYITHISFHSYTLGVYLSDYQSSFNQFRMSDNSKNDDDDDDITVDYITNKSTNNEYNPTELHVDDKNNKNSTNGNNDNTNNTTAMNIMSTPPVQRKGKKELLDMFHKVSPSSKSPVPVSPEEIAQKYGIPKTPRTVKCQVNGTTQIGWIPASSTVTPSNHSETSLIPRYIFQSWKTNELKEKICNNVLTWIDMNPEYDYFLFDDVAIDRFIQMEYGQDIHSAYSCVKVGAAKCDIWRLLAIYLFGGIYFDVDVRPKSPFSEWDFGNRTVVSGRGCNNRRHPTGCGHQWGLIYTPFHSVMHAAIEETLGNLAKREASHVYDVSYNAFYNAWVYGPFNSSYMPGWGDFMGNRVIFFDPAAKNTMMEDNGYWQDANSREKIWKSTCIDES
jgi:hypothetical protein